jgi:phosphoribosylformimino-5-aminoimidazole carboxamide ribotide isomerase
MRIIPVIDILDGVVVHAIAGDRKAYAPIRTPLAQSAEPAAIAHGLTRRFGCDSLYIADLNAIEGHDDNHAAIAAIAQRLPATRLWIDAGPRDRDALVRWRRNWPDADCVIGSERFDDIDFLRKLPEQPQTILSLDFLGSQFLGAPALLAEHSHWPVRVIVMTLSRVGVGAGPDMACFRDIHARAGARDVFAAGGVRDQTDIETLAAAGAAGALVATALHNGALAPAAIRSFRRQ